MKNKALEDILAFLFDIAFRVSFFGLLFFYFDSKEIRYCDQHNPIPSKCPVCEEIPD